MILSSLATELGYGPAKATDMEPGYGAGAPRMEKCLYLPVCMCGIDARPAGQRPGPAVCTGSSRASHPLTLHAPVSAQPQPMPPSGFHVQHAP
jgi:hypothetical protein